MEREKKQVYFGKAISFSLLICFSEVNFMRSVITLREETERERGGGEKQYR